MLTFTKGDMFDTPADIRVNTVNCVGVMGAGVALAFKTRYPEMFKDYKLACDKGEVRPGKLHIWKNLSGDRIVNFPTKRHWRDNSRYEDIDAGLRAFRTYLSQQGHVTVTLPALGCGHGGLDWDKVSKMIRERLQDVEAEIIVFEPADSRAAGAKVHEESERKLKEVLIASGVKMVYFKGAGASSEPDFAYVRGNGDLLQHTFISFASSQAPDEKERDAALACIETLAQDGLVLSLNYDAALSGGFLEKAINKGSNVVVWIAEGLMDFKIPDQFRQYVENGRLTVASVAKPRQKWKQELFDKTQRVNLMSGRVGIITEPRPLWLRSDIEGFSEVVNKKLFYLKYQDSNKRTAEVFRKLEAKPIGKNPETNRPNLSPILEIVHHRPASGAEEPPENLALQRPDENQVGSEASTQHEAPILIPKQEKMTEYPKRLIEVDLPIKRISEHARREKSIRHGHISTLHIWWARRPLAACRAVICAALWPDPADESCPPAFRNAAAKIILDFARKVTGDTKLANEHCSPENFKLWSKLGSQPSTLNSQPVALRGALLDFIADFANWDNSTVREYLDTSRA